jgi:hypothetical protein
MSKLTGYRTLAVNALLLIASWVGLQVSPETIQQHLNIAFGVFAGVNAAMRILTKGPVGQLVPQLGRFVAFEDHWMSMWSALPELFPQSVGSPAEPQAPDQPAPNVPAQAAAAQRDIEALLPIYAVKIATAINETLSETSKAD